ncbi:hypothetical protein ACFOVU_01465 [Nocardiopsis sediminis]|uniref:TRASH domain-containing protein n=1 Tax=Nocardiopsis sediminis TaxID=1778267 RepID=A0ABV8FEN7_9ACTN
MEPCWECEGPVTAPVHYDISVFCSHACVERWKAFKQVHHAIEQGAERAEEKQRKGWR